MMVDSPDQEWSLFRPTSDFRFLLLFHTSTTVFPGFCTDQSAPFHSFPHLSVPFRASNFSVLSDF